MSQVYARLVNNDVYELHYICPRRFSSRLRLAQYDISQKTAMQTHLATSNLQPCRSAAIICVLRRGSVRAPIVLLGVLGL